MTKITIIAATDCEIAPIVSCFGDRFSYVVTGMGCVATAVATIRSLSDDRPHLVLQVGVAGAIDRALSIAQAVVVSRDYVADLGAFREGDFVRFDSAIVEYPYLVDGFQCVRARTVSAACAPFVDDDSQIETMEGAAFMMVARELGVRFMQLRTISNYIDDPRSAWHLDEAVSALPVAVARLLNV